MPVYRLTPLDGTENAPQWRAATMRPYCLWIRARDEDDARQEVARATAVRSAAGGIFSPWFDKALAACEYDDDADVPSGIIRVRHSPVHVPPSPASFSKTWSWSVDGPSGAHVPSAEFEEDGLGPSRH